jgi:hypothetical protein
MTVPVLALSTQFAVCDRIPLCQGRGQSEQPLEV